MTTNASRIAWRRRMRRRGGGRHGKSGGGGRRLLIAAGALMALLVVAGGATAGGAAIYGIGRYNEIAADVVPAEELIATWRLANEDLTTNADGAFADHPGWSWRRSVTSVTLADSPGLLQIQLDLRYADALGEGHVAATYVWLEASDEPAR